MTQSVKAPEDQVDEIQKLVADAVDKLDQVLRALRSLQERLAHEASGGREASGSDSTR